jgi:hypothetical protein
MIPGTSCLATIVLSLRDKSHSPIEALLTPCHWVFFGEKPDSRVGFRAHVLLRSIIRLVFVLVKISDALANSLAIVSVVIVKLSDECQEAVELI